MRGFEIESYGLNQACQTQTTSRAANATKTDKRAAKVFTYVGQILQNIMINFPFYML